MSTLITALRATILTLVLGCGLYPLVVTALASGLFPAQARGSLVTDEEGRVVGSALLAQAFREPGYLQPRPSAVGYDAAASGGSNLGPTSAALRDRVAADLARLRTENPDAPEPVPAELVAASASGLDPHLSPDAARWQVPRIAKARGVAPERVRELIDRTIEGRTFGVLGETRVNVLAVNLALDRQFGRVPTPRAP